MAPHLRRPQPPQTATHTAGLNSPTPLRGSTPTATRAGIRATASIVRFSPPGTPETWLGGTYARWAASVDPTPLDRPNSNSSPEHHPSRGHRLPATRFARTEPHPDRRPLSRPDARLRLTPQVSRQSEAGPSVMALPVGYGPGTGWQFLLAEALGRSDDVRRNCAQRFAPVADRVLLRGGQLTVGQRFPVSDEDRVVAEAVVPPRLAHQPAGHLPLDHDLPPARGSERRGTDERCAPPAIRNIDDLVEQQPQVCRVVPVPAGPAGGEHARHAVQRVYRQPGVISDGDQPSRQSSDPGLRQGVVGEGGCGLRYLVVRRRIVQANHSQVGLHVGEDAPQLGEFVGIAGGEQHLRGHHAASTSAWILANWEQPLIARSSIASSSARRNGAPSAVPWTSTNSPEPVRTTFMSVSARTSSSYIRSSRASPSITPTDTADTELTSGSGRAKAC